MSVNEAVSLCDLTFEASQRALASGNIEEFTKMARFHNGYAELYRHLQSGGAIH